MLELNLDHVQLKREFEKTQLEPSWNLNRVGPIRDYDLWYIWEGEGAVTLNDTRFPVSGGSCLLIRPGDYISGTHNPAKPILVTYLHFALLAEPQSVPDHYRNIHESTHFGYLLDRYVSQMRSKMYGSEWEAKWILMQLLLHLVREDMQPVRQWSALQAMGEVVNYIHQYPARRHKIDELAQRANYSAGYFGKKFKELYGQSVESYIIKVRMERADYLLKQSSMNVAEVADALGYPDVYFFSRQFKQYMGLPPSKAR